MDVKLSGSNPGEIFPLLANAFGNDYTVKQAEYSLEIPENFGSGTITGIHYPTGVGFICLDVTFNEDVKFIYGSHQVHPLRFVYCLKNDVIHRFNNEGEGEDHTIERYSSAIIANKYPYGDTYTLPGYKKISLIFLDIDRKVFTSQLPQEAHDMKSIFYKIFFDTFATRTLYHKSMFSLRSSYLINQINEFGQEDYVRTNFIGAKALEMLSLMLLQYEDDLREEGNGRVMRKSEISAIHRVAEIIEDNLAELTGVEELAKAVSLTPAKLQEGFKLFYGYTVNQYIIDRRLEKGFWLLQETDSQIGEVVLEIGLSSRSHFSKIFKEKFGLSPIDVKMRRGVK